MLNLKGKESSHGQGNFVEITNFISSFPFRRLLPPHRLPQGLVKERGEEGRDEEKGEKKDNC